MRAHLLKARCENGKLILFLRVEVDLEYTYKVELSGLEKDVLEFILQNGCVTQKELSKRFGKVKACRIIQELERKGLIERRKKGKTYVIRVI